MLLLSIVFYFFLSGAFFHLFKCGKLDILWFNYERIFLVIRRSFKQNICYVHMPQQMLYLWSLMFKQCLSFESPSFSSHSGPHHLHHDLALGQTRGYVHVVKGFVPLATTLAFLESIIFLHDFHLVNSSSSCLDILMEFEPKADLDF